MEYIKFGFLWGYQKIANLFLPEEKRKCVILMDIPEYVLIKLKHAAAEEGITLSEYVNKILKEITSK